MLKLLKDHPSIVKLHEAFRRKGRLHLVFEYVPENLLEVLQQNPKGIRLDRVQRIIYLLFEALTWCHAHSIIHRDVKVCLSFPPSPPSLGCL